MQLAEFSPPFVQICGSDILECARMVCLAPRTRPKIHTLPCCVVCRLFMTEISFDGPPCGAGLALNGSYSDPTSVCSCKSIVTQTQSKQMQKSTVYGQLQI